MQGMRSEELRWYINIRKSENVGFEWSGSSGVHGRRNLDPSPSLAAVEPKEDYYQALDGSIPPFFFGWLIINGPLSSLAFYSANPCS